MSRETLEHTALLRDQYTERLHILEIQEAQFGMRVDAQIVIEIRDIKKKIIVLNEKIKLLLEIHALHFKMERTMVIIRRIGDTAYNLIQKSKHSEQAFKDLSADMDNLEIHLKKAAAFKRKIQKLRDKYDSM